MKIVIRPYSQEANPISSTGDDPYIYATWTRRIWYSPRLEVPVKEFKRAFFKRKSKEIKELLTKAHVKIACIKEDPHVVMGYIVVHEGKICTICIKNNYRGYGIEELLIKSMKDQINEDRDTGSGTVPEELSTQETP